MSALMIEDRRARLKRWLASGEMKLYPLSFPQRELWEAAVLPVADATNNISCLIPIIGAITPENCTAAMQRVVDRHEVLRLSFLPGKAGPMQMIKAQAVAVLSFIDIGLDDDVDQFAHSRASEPFDLLQGPLYRLDVLRRTPKDHVLVLTLHHSIADGWSLGVFVNDLYQAYVQVLMNVPGGLPAVPVSYVTWAAAERALWHEDELSKRAEFWRMRLVGSPRLWDQREDSSANTDGLHRIVTMLPAELGRSVRELARRNGATLFSMLLTVFQITMSRWTGAKDIIVGTPVANRSRQDVRETFGSFSSVVPLRGMVEDDQSFVSALRNVQRSTTDCFANAMPFAELVRAIDAPRIAGRNPVYEVRFALQNQPQPEVAAPGFSINLRVRSTGTPRFELACELTEAGEALEVVWLSRNNRFSAAEIVDLDCIFHTVVRSVCLAPESRVGAFLQ